MQSDAHAESSMDAGSTSKRRRVPSLSDAKASEQPSDASSDAAKAAKASKACLNCRKQKMKCELNGDPPCRRCRNTQTTCLFKVRANGIEAGDWFLSDLGVSDSAALGDFKTNVLARLEQIESRLGIWPATAESRAHSLSIEEGSKTDEDENKPALGSAAGLPDLGGALRVLVGQSREPVHQAWTIGVVEALWMAFAEHMPSFHFSTQRVFLDRPTPLLLAAILYASATQHPMTEYARLAPFYQAAAARAIAELCVPAPLAHSHLGGGGNGADHGQSQVGAYHDALGVVVTGLMSAASVSTTGLWISMAYQMIVAGTQIGTAIKPAEWRGLYEGLRVIDIEHASLRMSCPLLPLTPPLASLEQPAGSTTARTRAWTHLTTIMHVGLCHFSGRNLRHIMGIVLGAKESEPLPVPKEPSEADLRMIKGWAGELDAWLMRYQRPSRTQQRGVTEANIVLLQYQLHKLFVLSIYSSITGLEVLPSRSSEQHGELLAAARGALQLQRMGMSVWSNWDLVIITLAAMIIIDNMPTDLQNIREDRLLVQGHIHALRSTHQPAPNLRTDLASRLESRLAGTSSPAAPTGLSDATSKSLSFTLPDTGASDTLALQPFFMTPPDVQNNAFTAFDGAASVSAAHPDGGWVDPIAPGFAFQPQPQSADVLLWPPTLQRMMGGLSGMHEGADEWDHMSFLQQS